MFSEKNKVKQEELYFTWHLHSHLQSFARPDKTTKMLL